MAKPPAKNSPAKGDTGNQPDQEVCGIIMPISAMGDYSSSHWSEARRILDQAIEKAGMRPQIVSDSFETEIIQSRIIQNLYNNPVVVCDVSGLNPNVMFELGIRITFKKPVIIVADDRTKLPFDTSVIEHQFYPESFHFHKVNEFIDGLSDKIKRMADQNRDGSFHSFIEQFGQFQVLEPTTVQVGTDQFVLETLDEIKREIRSYRSETERTKSPKEISVRYRKPPEKLDPVFSVRSFHLNKPIPSENIMEDISRWINDQSEIHFRDWKNSGEGSDLRIVMSHRGESSVIKALINMLTAYGFIVDYYES